MSKARVYTQRTSISMRREHREEFEAALPEGASLGGWLRDSALRYVGMPNLVIPSDKDESRRFWRNEDREEDDDPGPAWVFLAINLTAKQKTVLHNAADDRSISMSALLQDALRLELGLRLVDEAEKGWQRGRRRSDPPKNAVEKIAIGPATQAVRINGSAFEVDIVSATDVILVGTRGNPARLTYDDARGQWIFRRRGTAMEAILEFEVLDKCAPRPRAKKKPKPKLKPRPRPRGRARKKR